MAPRPLAQLRDGLRESGTGLPPSPTRLAKSLQSSSPPGLIEIPLMDRQSARSNMSAGIVLGLIAALIFALTFAVAFLYVGAQ